jgi:hypothetical protein
LSALAHRLQPGALRGVAATAGEALVRHRRLVLAAIVVAQWGGVAVVALAARHNGWLYYHGGDGVFYWTTAWALGHFTIPSAQIGFGLGVFQAFGAAFLGPSMLSGLPFVLLLNVVVLLPLVPLLLYGVGERIAGRLFGLLVAALWLVLPLLAYRGFRPDYRAAQFLDDFLPGAVGLNALGDFPSLVVCLACVYLVFRAMDSGATTDALLAGTLAGFALAVKPSNALLLPAVVVGLALRRRLPQLLAFGCALAPAVLALAIWKERGLGSVPLFGSATGGVRLAAGSSPVTAFAFDRYLDFDWGIVHQNLLQLREVFWSKTLVEWTAFAGAFALLRRSWRKGVVVAIWFAAYFLAKGGSPFSSVYAGSFFRLLEPAYPAFVLFGAAALVLLVPGARAAAVAPPRPASRRTVAIAVAVLGLFPLVFVAAARPSTPGSFAVFPNGSAAVRIVDLQLAAAVAGGEVRLHWRVRPAATADVGYRIFRAATESEDCTLATSGSRDCAFGATGVSDSADPAFVDRPGRGTWTYRVAVVASFDGDSRNGDPLLLSRPVTISVR